MVKRFHKKRKILRSIEHLDIVHCQCIEKAHDHKAEVECKEQDDKVFNCRRTLLTCGLLGCPFFMQGAKVHFPKEHDEGFDCSHGKWKFGISSSAALNFKVSHD